MSERTKQWESVLVILLANNFMTDLLVLIREWLKRWEAVHLQKSQKVAFTKVRRSIYRLTYLLTINAMD